MKYDPIEIPVTEELVLPKRAEVVAAAKSYSPGAIFYGVIAAVCAWANAILFWGFPAFMVGIFTAAFLALGTLVILTFGGNSPSDKL